MDRARIPLEDAIDLCAILVATRRHVPADRWVDEWAAQYEAGNLESLGAC